MYFSISFCIALPFDLNFKVFILVGFRLLLMSYSCQSRWTCRWVRKFFSVLFLDDNFWSVGFYLTICLYWHALLYHFLLTLYCVLVSSLICANVKLFTDTSNFTIGITLLERFKNQETDCTHSGK